ncbi:MAG: 16S rRNA (guanine(527)-N(7))-methyltransferase RsmG [Bacteroidales bacterium]|nr:16S rRNA (guanine(527)-N(7))-methyltransferase RsmG [Bacteroidales bacterium]
MLVEQHFSTLTERQRQQFAALPSIYERWNACINVISRRDMDQFELHHVLHSLALAKVVQFKPMCQVLDLGTGGGFPGVPLAIMFPDTRFTLVDSIGKKIKVVQGVVDELGLTNVTAVNARVETLDEQFDFVVSRAVAPLSQMVGWVRGKISRIGYHNLHNGMLCLKGGDLTDELSPFGKRITTWDVSSFFSDDYFTTKKIIHLPLK